MENSSNSIVEEREEHLVSPAGRNLGRRTGHFIKPSIGPDSISDSETAVSNIPRHAFSSLPTVFEPRKWPLEVKFYGWRYPRKKWKTWVVKMAALHESTWKKAGIFEAIMNSTYAICKNSDLVLGVAEKWCDETKSFIFPWGEATITLEDIMILGGYSVLGSPLFTPVETEEMKETREILNKARKEICKSTCKKAYQCSWMRKFMNSDSTVEHEAFLALWLSRFVLPSFFYVVSESIFPIAIHLSRGTRIALAPAVLAKIYGDLSLLKKRIVASTRLLEFSRDDANDAQTVILKSPLALVQVWIWERFFDLKPEPNLIKKGEPRFALWHDRKCKKGQDVRSVLESAKERFEWCPYVRKITDCDGAKFHGDDEMRISLDSSLNYELLSFARCLRPSELVGLDCVEQYLPHRVALQFGMNQDIPGSISRSNDSNEIAWADYNKSFGGGELYISSRSSKAGFTIRYLKWWKNLVSSLREAGEDVLEEQRSFGDSKLKPKRTEEMDRTDVFTSFKMIPKSLKRAKEGNSSIGFKMIPKKFKGMTDSNAFFGPNINQKKCKRAKEGTAASTQPGDFHPKGLKRPRWLLTQKKRGNKATAGLGSSLKRSKKAAQYPKFKSEVHTAGFTAQRSKGKKGKNVSRPHESPPKSSKAPALSSDVSNEDKTETTSASSLFIPLKELPLNFVIQKELNNSPFPPGFLPKEHVVQAKGSVNDDMVIPSVPPGFSLKCISEDVVTPVAPPGFPPKCINEDEVTPADPSGFPSKCINEDEVTPAAPPGFPPNCIDEDEVTPATPPGFPPKYINEDEVTPAAPPGFPPKCINEAEVTPAAPPGFPPKCINEAEVTPAAPPGFPPKCIDEDECELTIPGTPSLPHNHNIMEVGDSINGDKLTATKILRSTSKHEIVGNKECGNYDKSESYVQNLSEDSHKEDQQTVAEMLNSHHKLDNGDCKNAGEGKNSSGHGQSSSSSNANMELPGCREGPTTLVQNAIPTEAASGELSRTTIQDEDKSTSGRTLGSSGSPDDKVASMNCVEVYGNSYGVEKPNPDLEARVSKLEKLFAYIKAARKVKAKVINIMD